VERRVVNINFCLMLKRVKVNVKTRNLRLRVDPIILKDLCHLVQSLLLDHRQPTSVLTDLRKKKITFLFIMNR
jgi:hypothetical protein